MKTLSKLGGLLAVPLVIGLAGCSGKIENTFYRTEYKNYPAEIGMYGSSDTRYITIGVNNSVYGPDSDSSGEVNAWDFENDGRFDKIYRNNLSKGHPLENEFDSFESLDKAYEEIESECTLKGYSVEKE